MDNSYHEIMEHIEITDEMRERILQTLSAAESVRQPDPAPKLRFFPLRKCLEIAACAALLLLGGTFFIQYTFSTTSTPSEVATGPSGEIVTCSSAAELSEKAGFVVSDIEKLPFVPLITTYSWCWNDFAEITYESSSNTACYRKTRGTEDISGDYSDYTQIITETIKGTAVTLKENDNSIFLAIWQKDGYSFSLSFSDGISYDVMIEILKTII